MIDGLRAVVFDWAGTMVDHGCRAPVLALRRAFADHGVTVTEEEVRADMGRAKRDHIRALLAVPAVQAAWWVAHDAAPDEADVDRLHDTVEPLMAEAGAACADLIAGAAPLAARLRAAGVRIGSSTGYTRAMLADILPRAAAQGYAPEVAICAGEVASGRPAPLMMWKALVELDAWPAAAAVKVDDATVGIAEGRAAGSWTVGVAASGNGVGLDAPTLAGLSVADRDARVSIARDALRAAGATEVVDTVADLWPALERIAARARRGERPA